MLICFFQIRAQNKSADTTKIKVDTVQKKGFITNIFNRVMNSIQQDEDSSSLRLSVLNDKLEDPFKPYTGRIIRNIFIQQLGFESSFEDTASQKRNLGTRILHALHRESRKWVIRQSLFIKEYTPLNPYVLADNERFLRTLRFFNDARILVLNVSGCQDSVDLIIVTQDVLTLTAEVRNFSTERIQAVLSEVNVGGLGQTLKYTMNIQKDRKPVYGNEILYTINNLAGSFINGSFLYSNINPHLKDNTPDENAWYLKFDRPLVSQYIHFAGGLTIGQNKTIDRFNKIDSLNYRYSYSTVDSWIGYNVGVHKNLQLNSNPVRKFFALRYFNYNFSLIPSQIKNKIDFRFNSREALLGEVTLFRQNFYRTNYILGFGITEDVPYGYTFSLIGGWYRQSILNRYYSGLEFANYHITKKGDGILFFLRSGAFYNKGNWQDVSFLSGVSMFSRLYLYKNLKIRNYVRFSYTKLFNRLGLDPLNITNTFGVREFNADSLLGSQRISLRAETFFFIKPKILGFKFAPFLFGELSALTPEKQNFSKTELYYGLGGGIRTRNEKLVFGTIELRFSYFPRIAKNTNQFEVSLSTNLRFRFSSNYVRVPDIVQVNDDPDNNLY